MLSFGGIADMRVTSWAKIGINITFSLPAGIYSIFRFGGDREN